MQTKSDNITMLKAAIENLIRNIPGDHAGDVRRITAGCYRNRDGKVHAHAQASVTVKFTGYAEKSEGDDYDK